MGQFRPLQVRGKGAADYVGGIRSPRGEGPPSLPATGDGGDWIPYDNMAAPRCL